MAYPKLIQASRTPRLQPADAQIHVAGSIEARNVRPLMRVGDQGAIVIVIGPER